ncbi:histone H3-K9 methyltransferase, WIYLD domain protein [Artemisia annua]|uniref:Histone H3-K9 methyltransferase, WIYLD domain protein n=1 Tax=Artemisia annua TaxID=35608 RepID=A0A2U1PIL3_ARTAN|nr:histone H3-K9 methyltransferase, WIYLD domain protein [Artemisia annua]
MVLDKRKLRFDNEVPDFNLLDEPDEEEIEPLRKKPRRQNRPSTPAGSSVPCSSNYASEMQQMVEPDFGAMDVLEPAKPEVRIEKVQHDTNLFGDSDDEENEAQSQDRPSSPAVMKQVEEKYQENFRGLGVEFTLSELLKEICDCFVEQGNMSDGNNQSLVQTFENFMEAEKQCGQLSLSTTPSDHTDAPVPIPRSVVSSPFTYVHEVNGVYSDVFDQTFRKQKTPVVDNLSGSTHLTLCLKYDYLQRGTQANLQVFMTSEGKGWGLRTLEDLPKGTFVCEHVGEIVSNTELFERNEQNTDEKHTYPVLLDANWSSEGFLKDMEALCLDATSFGNVARFINHRCKDANLVAIPVEVESPDHHYYHHVFFTARDVKAMEELTWDYGIDFDDDSHPVKAFHCKCGSSYCRQTNHKKVNMAQDKQLIVRMK